MVRKKKQAEKSPLLDDSHPSLRWTVLLSEGDIRAFAGDTASLNMAELRASIDGGLEVWTCWESFYDNCTLEDLARVAKRIQFKHPGDKLNKLDLSLLIWRDMCKIARVEGSSGRTKGAASRSAGKLANRKYVRVKDSDLSAAEIVQRDESVRALCPQASVCYQIFISAGTDEVPEARMRELVEEHADEIKTKQDPWRIFQYYRPMLIRERLIRLV